MPSRLAHPAVPITDRRSPSSGELRSGAARPSRRSAPPRSSPRRLSSGLAAPGLPPRGGPLALALRAALAAILFTIAPSALAGAQEPPAAGADRAPPDSAALRAEAEEAQAAMERYRGERIPPALAAGGGRCDDLIGRMCSGFGSPGARTPLGTEPPEVAIARMEVLRTLAEAGNALPGDAWILGQRVFYLVEDGSAPRAANMVAACRLPDKQRWWCDALLGYALHGAGATAAADSAFDAALATMPAEERARWEAPTWLLDGDGRDRWEDTPAGERPALFEQLWLLADPLYLVPLNDRRTEHRARRTLVLIREHARNPYGLDWEEDLEQLTVRYGAEAAWERERGLVSGDNPIQDTRRIVGRHHPESRDYVPPGWVLAAPATAPVGPWVPEAAKPRTGYAPPYAPVIDALDAQVARFRRGDSLLLVAAFAPRAPEPERPRAMASPERPPVRDPFARDPQERERAAPDPFAGGAGGNGAHVGGAPLGAVEAGLFLIAPDGSARRTVQGERANDVLTLLAPNGAWIVGAEVFEPAARRAWRARGGVTQDEPVLDVPSVSDLLVLDVADGGPPDTFDEAVPRARADLRFRVGEPFGLAWEVYGLRTGQSATVAIGFSRSDPGLLRRAGEFLRLVEPSEPVLLTWEDAGPDRLGTVFRAVDLALPELEPGEYTLVLEIQLAGREPLVATRTVRIVE